MIQFIRRHARPRAPFVLWISAAVVVVTSIVWGRRLEHRTPWIKLGAAPLVGIDEQYGWETRFGWRSLPALLAVVTCALVLPRIVRAVSFRVMLLCTALSAAAVSLLLALTEGEEGVLRSVYDPAEYWEYVPSLRPGGDYFRTYVDRLTYMPTHYRGHPPLYPFLLKGLHVIGLEGPWPVAVLSLAGTALIPVGVLCTVRVVGSESMARALAPFLVLVPYTLWETTSADALFSAMGSLSICALAFAANAQPNAQLSEAPNTEAIPSRSNPLRVSWWLWAIGAGVLFALLAHATYGAATLSFVFVGVAVSVALGRKRNWANVGRLVGVVGLAGLAVTVGFVVAGFWWGEGLAATRIWYWKGTAQFRTWTYFSLLNVAVLLIALGPAFLRGIHQWITDSKTRMGKGSVLVFTSLASVGAATLSQMSKGEIERIWLPFYPWMIVATAWIPEERRQHWLLIQALVTFALGITLVSKW